MDKLYRKIITGVLMCGGTLLTIIAAAHFSTSGNNEVRPVALTGLNDSTPTIVLDAGHGGIDGGCTSADGIPEKGINLSILLRLRDLLRISGYEVVVTRDSDRSIHDDGVEGIAAQKSSDMDNRLALFNSEQNAVCISIHQNQFTDPIYSGAQMFYSASNKRNEALAQSLQSSFAELLQPDNTREIKQCGKELFLCYYSENPTVMAECGFLSNPEEAALLNTEEYQQKVAMVLFKGLSDFLEES